MTRRAGTGLIALGIVLGVAGAVMRYAVSATANGFDVHQAGFILLLVGIGVVVLGILIFSLGGRSRDTSGTYAVREPGWRRGRGRRRWRR
jgi:hypothetical protein